MGLTSKEADEECNESTKRLHPIFASKSGFQNAQEYTRGLIGPVERKGSLVCHSMNTGSKYFPILSKLLPIHAKNFFPADAKDI